MPPQIQTSTNATMALVLVGIFGMEIEQDAKIRPLLPNMVLHGYILHGIAWYCPLLPNMVLHGLHGNAYYSGEILHMNWPHSLKTENWFI